MVSCLSRPFVSPFKWNVSLNFFANFSIWLVVNWVFRILYIFWIQALCLRCVLQIFSPVLQSAFSPSFQCLSKSKCFWFWRSSIGHFFLLCFMLFVSQEIYAKSKVRKVFLVFSSRSFTVLGVLHLRLWYILCWFLYMVQRINSISPPHAFFFETFHMCLIVPFENTTCWKDYTFSLNFLGTFVENLLTIGVRSGFFIYRPFSPVPHSLNICSFIVNCKSR